MKLEELLRLPEGKTLEYKRDLSSSAPVLRTLVAFANSAGGRVIIGVEDGTRVVTGIASPLDLEEKIANLIADSIMPALLPEIEIIPWRKTHVVVVTAHPSALRPHHLRSEGPERGTYVRLGSTNRVADSVLIAELSRRVGAEGFDEEPVTDLDSEALDFGAASQLFAEHRTLRRRDLPTLGLVRRHQGRTVPTIAGVLLFGRERLARFPDAYLQVGAFAGTDRSRFVDRADLTAYPGLAIEQAIGFVERNTRLGTKIGRVRRRDLPAVPPLALREAVVNAVVHADYAQRGAPIRVAVFDDRVEVENPGVLLPGLTIEELQDGVSRVRNRGIARVFKEVGLIEQWGTGVQRMNAACAEAGLSAPEFVELGFRFRVTIRTERISDPVLDPKDGRIIDFIRSGSGRSTAEIAAHVGISTRATQQRLAALAERGLVVVVGSGPRDPKRRWFTTDQETSP
ncbi:MAG: ATP-binding protein [Candidatus Eisenbacteria bacterium]